MGFKEFGRYIKPISTQLFSYGNTRSKSITKMTTHIMSNKEFAYGINPNEPLMVKKFIPKTKNNVSIDYYPLISIISRYFNVYSVWVYKVIPNTIEPIRTIWMFGYKEEVMLASRYIANEINNIEAVRLNRQAIYRKRKKKGRAKGYGHKTEDARTKAKRVMLMELGIVVKAWEEALLKKGDNPFQKEKYTNIRTFMESKLELNYDKYTDKPRIERAFCRKNCYQKNRIIW